MAAAEGTHRPSTASLCAGFLRQLFAVVAFVEIDFGQASFCPSMLAAAFWVSRRSAVASRCISLLTWEEKASMGSDTQPVVVCAGQEGAALLDRAAERPRGQGADAIQAGGNPGGDGGRDGGERGGGGGGARGAAGDAGGEGEGARASPLPVAWLLRASS